MNIIWPTISQYDEPACSVVVQAKPIDIDARPAATTDLVPNR